MTVDYTGRTVPAQILADLLAWDLPDAHAQRDKAGNLTDVILRARAALAAASPSASDAGSGADVESMARELHTLLRNGKEFPYADGEERRYYELVVARWLEKLPASPPASEAGSGAIVKAATELVNEWYYHPQEGSDAEASNQAHFEALENAVLAAAQPAPVAVDPEWAREVQIALDSCDAWTALPDANGTAHVLATEVKRLRRAAAQPAPSEPVAGEAAEVLDGLIAEMRGRAENWHRHSEAQNAFNIAAALVEAARQRVGGERK